MHKQHVGLKLQCFDIRELIANISRPSYSGSVDLQRWEHHCSQKYKHLEVLFSEKNYRNVEYLQPLPLEDVPVVAVVVLGSWNLWDATFGFGDQNLQKW